MSDSMIARIVAGVTVSNRRTLDEPFLPASDSDLAGAARWVKQWYGVELPPELVEYWRLSDGLGMVGTSLYSIRDRREPGSSTGLIDFHEELRAQDLYDDAVAHLMAVGNRDG